MYPTLIFVFLTKCNGLRSYLDRSFLAIHVPFHDLHSLHLYSGTVIAWLSVLHAGVHVLRWWLSSCLHFLYSHPTGRSGALALLILPFIVLPMVCGPLRKRMTFEARKGMHMWLGLGFGMCMVFHAPKAHISYIMGLVLAIYALDLSYCMFCLTYKVDTTEFFRLERGTHLSFQNPEGFRPWQVGYVYVNIPWISKYEWHPFTLYPHLTAPSAK